MPSDVQCGWVLLAIGCQIGYQKAPLPAEIWEGGSLRPAAQAGVGMYTCGSPKSM